jgi:hypothetical protein
MAAVPSWVCWNRNRTISGFLLKRLFMLPRHSRQYTPSSVPNPSLCPPNPSLCPCVLDILVGPCIDVGNAHAGALKDIYYIRLPGALASEVEKSKVEQYLITTRTSL